MSELKKMDSGTVQLIRELMMIIEGFVDGAEMAASGKTGGWTKLKEGIDRWTKLKEPLEAILWDTKNV